MTNKARKKIAQTTGMPGRVMVFGTFDMIHQGHRHFFQQARALAGKKPVYLIVSLARDKNVSRIKGKQPRKTEKMRLNNIAALPEVNKAVLGAVGNHIPHIARLKPDIIALGYDQTAYVSGLRKQLKAVGINPKIVRLKPHKPRMYKTSLLQK